MKQRTPGGAVALFVAFRVAAASAWLILNKSEALCERLAPLTVLAALAAFALALAFRKLSSAEGSARWTLACALLIAGATLFANAHFVLQYRALCGGLEEQLHQLNHH